MRPATIPYTMSSALAFQLAHHVGVRGPSLTVTVAGTSSALAIAQGARLIAVGEATVVLVRGGCDSMQTPLSLRAWRPDAPSQAQAMSQALTHSGVQPPDIRYVNAHGTAKVVGDLSEGPALREVFGEYHSQLPISSTKALHGHVIGGAGALEAIVTLEVLRCVRVPGNPHSQDVDPALANLNIFHEVMDLPPASRRFDMSNSFAFGGVNAVLVLESCSDRA